jgi:hypothetical protein
MKIKYLIIPLFFLTLWIFAEGCEYLREQKNNLLEMNDPLRFNYEYTYQLCLLNEPIHKEVIEHIRGIRDTKWKKIGEMITDTGNTFCRGYFWDCNEESFYWKFLQSCEDARTKTRDILVANKVSETVSAELIWFSYTSCPALAESYITAYKEVAAEEVARYHSKAIESSNNEYLQKAHEKWSTVSGYMNSFAKAVSNWTKSVQWFTKEIFLGEPKNDFA